MLHARAAVELQVLVDLALALPGGRLVDRKLDRVAVVGHHDAHQRAVLGVDVLVVEADEPLEAEDPRVPVGPVVHLSELDVADDVVDAQDADVVTGHVARRVAGQERSVVVVERDERVQRVAVRVDRRAAHSPVLIGDVVRLDRRLRRLVRPLPRRRDPHRRPETRCRGRRHRGREGARRPDARDCSGVANTNRACPASARTTSSRARPSRVLNTRTEKSRRPSDRRMPPVWRCRPRTRRGGSGAA